MAEKQPSNPIDKDKVADDPHKLPYAHHVGSSVIKPIDKGRVKGRAVAAMYEQTERQLDQIREQIELLARQARELQTRVEISERIYQAEMNFEPLVGHVYHLYRRKDGTEVLSMVAPEEWGRTCPLEFVATVRLLADHTWEVLHAEQTLGEDPGQTNP
ncbi:MAG: DUF2452 domain-containing protein [Bacteroidetes bacterium]|nr:MAG: DUF2452 domain-containing protein [Bacteroidota bacterium]